MNKTYKFLLFALAVILILALAILAGYSPGFLAKVIPFFDGYTAAQLYVGLGVAFLWVIPNFGVKFFNGFKAWLGVEDLAAHKALIVLQVAGTVLLLVLTGSLDLAGMELNLTNLVYYMTEAYFISQVAYKASK